MLKYPIDQIRIAELGDNFLWVYHNETAMQALTQLAESWLQSLTLSRD